jgi:hypothetical protein
MSRRSVRRGRSSRGRSVRRGRSSRGSSRGRSVRKGRSVRRGRSSRRSARRGRSVRGRRTASGDYYKTAEEAKDYLRESSENSYIYERTADILTEELIRGKKIDQNEEVKYKKGIAYLAKMSLMDFMHSSEEYEDEPNSTPYTQLIAEGFNNVNEPFDAKVLNSLKPKLIPKNILKGWA